MRVIYTSYLLKAMGDSPDLKNAIHSVGLNLISLLNEKLWNRILSIFAVKVL